MQKIQDIVKTATFNASIQKVWEKISTAEGIGAWFMPNDFEPRVGMNFIFNLHSDHHLVKC